MLTPKELSDVAWVESDSPHSDPSVASAAGMRSRQRSADDRDDVAGLDSGQVRTHRERQSLARECLCYGQRLGWGVLRQRWLAVEGPRVIGTRFDAIGLECALQTLSPGGRHNVQVKTGLRSDAC